MENNKDIFFNVNRNLFCRSKISDLYHVYRLSTTHYNIYHHFGHLTHDPTNPTNRKKMKTKSQQVEEKPFAEEGLTVCKDCGCFIFTADTLHCSKCGKARLEPITTQPEAEQVEEKPEVETALPVAKIGETAEETFMRVQKRLNPRANYYTLPTEWQLVAMEEYANLRVAQALKK